MGDKHSVKGSVFLCGNGTVELVHSKLHNERTNLHLYFIKSKVAF